MAALESKLKVRAKTALNLAKSLKTPQLRDVQENSSQNHHEETFYIYCNEKMDLRRRLDHVTEVQALGS